MPSILLGLYTRGFNAMALLAGWAAGTLTGTTMAAVQGFSSSIFPLEIFGVTLPGYAALYSVGINVVIALTLSPVFDFLARRRRTASARS